MKRVGLFLMCLLFLGTAQAQQRWQEGTDYQVINHKATTGKEVREFFSFWCPHCFRYEALVKMLEQQLPEDVEFVKVHVDFMGFTTREIQQQATAAMLVGRALGKEQELNEAMFNYIHLQGSKFNGLQDFRSLFFLKGVSGEEFDKLINSFNIRNRVLQNNNSISEFTAYFQRVPTFFVNGKYKVQITNGMTPQDFVDLIVWLSQRKD